LSDIEQVIGYKFKDPKLLEVAFTHVSEVRGLDKSERVASSYDRLEYLGDRVLGLVVASELFDKNPHDSEGDLTKKASSITNNLFLAKLARKLELDQHIRIQIKGHNEKILSDIVEAVFGAIYLEAGFETAQMVIKNLMRDSIKKARPNDPKSELIKMASKFKLSLPVYATEKLVESYRPIFQSNVSVGGEVMGTGFGPIRKRAEIVAAKKALKRLRKIHRSH